jgi:two-component system sensor histidine kinase KdpD
MNGKAELVTTLPAGSDSGSKVRSWRSVQSWLEILRGCLAGLAAVVLVTFLGLRLHLNLSTSGFLCFLIVVMVSVVWGFFQASVTSLIAVGCLNYFFVPPLFTWTVSDPQNWVALATFEVAALAVSRLSTHAQQQARAEARHRAEVEKLYALSRRILLLDRRQNIGPQIVSLIQEIFRAESVALFDAASARIDAIGSRASDLEQLARSAYFRDGTLPGADENEWADVVRLGSKPAGALAIRGPEVGRNTIVPVASLAAIALERARSFEKESGAEAARQSEQLRTAVLDSLAHAFKSPLTAIWTASSGLLEGGRLSGDDVELATLIDEQSQHLNRLATELLQMARIDAAKVSLQRERIAVRTLIENVVDAVREPFHAGRVAISYSVPHLEVFADRKILSTALEQFLDNAFKYSTPGSPIAITAEENLGEIVISVHNEGPAIQPADRERIFERFYRAQESRHRASGTGLGLSIVKKAAEAHGGRVWVVSEEGTGTTFYFALPRGIKENR